MGSRNRQRRKDMEFLRELLLWKEQVSRHIHTSKTITEEDKKEFKHFEIKLECLLYAKKNIDKISEGKGMEVDTDKQEIVGVRATNDPLLHAKVSEVYCNGYTRHGEIFLKQMVEVFKTQ